ncbi:MAG: hypothetical protein V1898_03465 [Patescibacteria group bacterium]
MVLRKDSSGHYCVVFATPPDSATQKKLDQQIIAPEQIEAQKNTKLEQDVGGETVVLINTHSLTLEEGDIVLLSCDGETDPLRINAIPAYENGSTNIDAASRLSGIKKIQEIADKAQGDPVIMVQLLRETVLNLVGKADKDDDTLIAYRHELAYDWESHYSDPDLKKQAKQYHHYLMETHRSHSRELSAMEGKITNIKHLIEKIRGRAHELKQSLQYIEQELTSVIQGNYQGHQEALFNPTEQSFFQTARQPRPYRAKQQDRHFRTVYNESKTSTTTVEDFDEIMREMTDDPVFDAPSINDGPQAKAEPKKEIAQAEPNNLSAYERWLQIPEHQRKLVIEFYNLQKSVKDLPLWKRVLDKNTRELVAQKKRAENNLANLPNTKETPEYYQELIALLERVLVEQNTTIENI